MFGNASGWFFTATPDGEVKTMSSLFDGKGNGKNDIVDFSPNYFYIKSTKNIYAKKGLKSIGMINWKDSKGNNIKEINQKR